MITKNMSKKEIEDFLKGKGDFVQIDHLARFVDGNVPVDKKRFCYQKLADLYAKKRMFREAAKMYHNIAVNSPLIAEKQQMHIKEAEQCIKAGAFEAADDAMKKAINEASVSQSAEIYVQMKEFYKQQAEVYEKARKSSQAARVYEKLLELRLTDKDREEIKTKLMHLYEGLGRLKEYFSIKDRKFDSEIRRERR